MKTIEEAAMDCAANAPCGIPNFEEDDFNAGFLQGTMYGFVSGVEFAQRWISIDDELPEEKGKYLVKSRSEYVVIAYFNGKYFEDLDFTKWKEARFWRLIEFKTE